MDTLYIFGDSFADPNHTYAAAPDYLWIEELSKKFTVHNFAKKGTGPEWQNEILFKLINSENLSNSNLLYIMSHTQRRNWCFLEPSNQFYIPYIMSPDRGGIFDRQDAKKYNKYSKWLRNHSRYDGVSEDLKILNAYSFVYICSQHFNKTLFWPAFQLIPKKFIKNTQKFDTIEKTLFGISEEENYPDTKKNNHLHKINHEIMLQEIVKWMKTNYKINSNNFRKNINE
jgi:hypothetical protein